MRFNTLSHRELLAQGNGQILSSMDLRGLGLVLKYDRVGATLRYPPTRDLIPSVAQDKLNCGIIPGMLQANWSSDDRHRDLRLIGSDSQPSMLLQHMAWISDRARELLQKFPPFGNTAQRFSHAINDWISVSLQTRAFVVRRLLTIQ